MVNINQFVLSMQNGPENFVLSDEGSIDKFLGIKVKRLGPKEFEISQPFLIDHIVTFLGLKPENMKYTVMTSSLQQQSRSSTRI